MTRNRLRRFLDDAAAEPTTLIGAGCTFEGDFTGKGNFIIGGAVIGNCDIDGTVTLSVGGSWEGNLRAHDIIVAGTVRGEVVARAKLEIGATARIVGVIGGAEIAIAEGAIIDGGMHMTGAGQVTHFTEKRTADSGSAKPED